MFDGKRFTIAVLFCVSWSGSAGRSTCLRAELRVDDVMYQDPETLLSKYSPAFSGLLKPLWLEALGRSDGETRRLGADTITAAVRRGMPGLEDTSTALLALIESDDDPVIRRAAAQALVALQAKQATDALSQVARTDGLLTAQIVEPALAEWNEPRIREVWLKRLEDSKVERGLLLLAIDGLATTREERATASLKSIMENDGAPREIRIASARAIGQIHQTGLVELASQMASRTLQPDFLGPLLGVSLLVRHGDPAVVELLQRLASHPEPVVSVVALRRLRDIDLALALPYANAAIASLDAKMRHLGAEILAAKADVTTTQSLGPLLNDRNPDLRRFVSQKYVDFAQRDDLKPIVLEQSVKMLGSNEWRGLEQAALVLGTLDYEPVAPRLLELLPNPRPEVAVSSAWALRKLKVSDTMTPMLQFAETLHAKLTDGTAAFYLGKQTSQIFQAFGEMRFRDAEPLMRRFVPKSMIDADARTAACFALGYLYENQPDEELAKAFAERLTDVASVPPEAIPVRRLTAVGLGRMKAQSQLEVLRAMVKSEGFSSTPGVASGWAVEHMTGEKMAPAPPLQFLVTGWFLEPLEE